MPKEAKNKEKKQKSHFIKDTKAELKKVIWPTPKQLLNSTLSVIAIVVFIGVIVFVLDFCFNKINSYGVDKLKAVQTTTNTTESESNSETSNENTNSVTSEEVNAISEQTTSTESSTSDTENNVTTDNN